MKQTGAAQFIFKLCFCLTLVSNLVMYLVQPLDITLLNALASRCFMLTNLAAFFVVFLLHLRHYDAYRTGQLILIILMVCFSFVSYVLSDGVGLYSYIIHIWCYMALPFYFLYLDYLTPDRRLLHFIYLLSILSSLVFIGLSFSSYSYMGYEDYEGGAGACLTLGYDNPNQTAMYLVITLIILYSAIFYYRSVWMKAILLADCSYLVFLLTKTNSRICIFIGLLLTVQILLRRRSNAARLTVIGYMLLPVVFLLVYASFYNEINVFLNDTYRITQDTRGIMFETILSSMKDNFIFGDFSSYQLPNAHNGVLSIYASLGIVGLLLYYLYMLRAYFHIISGGLNHKVAYTAFLGLLAVFIHACVESSFLTAGSMYAGSLSALICLARYQRNNL
jgi:hypothetical protein